MQNFKKIKQRAEKLKKVIDEYRYRYHVLDDPTITDESYDSLMEELRGLEKKYPQLKTPDSPTQRVGGEPLDKFEKVKHKTRQWSLDDAFDFEEMNDWEERNKRILEKTEYKNFNFQYAVEVKIDGLKIILDYKKGLLVQGATRGDGKIGEKVTENIKTIQSVPLKLKYPLTLTVVGESWLSNKELKRINEERKKQGLPEFANSRNAGAGSIRQLDPKVAAGRKLNSFIYDLDYIEKQEGNIKNGEKFKFPQTQIEELKFLEELGFKVNKNYKLCQNLESVKNIYQEWKNIKDKQPYGIDGLVIKINDKKIQDILGHTGKSPRYAVAWKFPAEKTTTIIKNIKVQVGRTGALTPVAILRPVRIAGSMVSRATLHNKDEINKKDIRLGDTVVVQKAGDVIPEVVEVIKKLRTGKEKKFSMPKKCPICGGEVQREIILDKRKQASAAHYCTNKNCFAIEREKIIHFISRKGFAIEGLGEKIVEQLINEGLISDVADIFYLTKGDLEPLERFAQKSADNLIRAIEKNKKINLSNLLFALGIRHLGEESAFLIIDFLEKNNYRISSPNDLIPAFNGLKPENLLAIKGIGERMAQSLIDWFGEEKNQKILRKMTTAGIKLKVEKKEKISSSPLTGKTIVLTGALKKYSRDEAKKIIRDLGGLPSSSVSAKTDFVLAGADPGSKYDKAKKLGVKIINEEEFKKMIQN